MNLKDKSSLHKRFNSHKRHVLGLLLILSGSAVIIFAVVNYFRAKYVLFTVELIGAGISFILLYFLKSDLSYKLYQHVALAYVLLFCLFLLIVFARLDIYITAYNFVLLMPLIAHLLLGVRLGFIVTATFLLLSAIIFINRFQDHVIITEQLGFYNVVIVVVLIWGLSFHYERTNEHARTDLIHLASHDFLTGLFNRTMLSDVFHHKLEQSIKEQQPLSLLTADLDYFKNINDLYGHDAGDAFIRKFSEILQKHSGSKSDCFRVGGEEFCVILSSTDHDECHKIAENIRSATEKIRLQSNQHDIPVTVSIGIVTCYGSNCSLSDLLKFADKNLYKAKQQGRNRVVG